MPYPRYGKVFKKIRLQKHLPLSYFQDFGISKASLDKFELGQSMLSFERLDMALQAMNVTLAEYEHFINNFSLDYKEELLENILQADIADNQDLLETIAEEAMNSNHKFIGYCAKSRYGQLTQEEADDVVEFLYGIDEWGYYELSIFYFTLDSFSEREIMHLMQEFWKKSCQLFGILKYRRRVLQSSYRAVVVLSAMGARNSAKKILRNSFPTDRIHDLYVENLRNLAHGFYVHCFKDKNLGEQQIQAGLEVFRKVGYQDLENFYQKRYERLLKKEL